MAIDDSPSPHNPYPHWQSEYKAALIETDREKLVERVVEAETAIFNRLQTIAHSEDYRAERQAIEDARTNLRVLKWEGLGFPDWGQK